MRREKVQVSVLAPQAGSLLGAFKKLWSLLSLAGQRLSKCLSVLRF